MNRVELTQAIKQVADQIRLSLEQTEGKVTVTNLEYGPSYVKFPIIKDKSVRVFTVTVSEEIL